MENAVFILGAGASAPFGVPTLLCVFKDRAARQHLNADIFLNKKLHELFWVPRGHTLETSDRSLSVEEILTLVRDYENQAYGVPSLLGQETERFKRSLYVLIKKAVYDGKSSRNRFLNPIINFARSEFKHVTWASFNWDCIFEASYYYSGGPHSYYRHNPQVTFDLKNWQNTINNNIFLKLHGGVNWWYEKGEIFYLPFGTQPELNDRWEKYELNNAEGNPVILEPSYYKYEDPIYKLLKNQWQHFVDSLIKADIIVVLGYSLPEADSEARRALSIGFQSNPKVKLLVIDHANWVCERYIRLFGSDRVMCIRKGIEDIYNQIPDLIRKKYM